MKIYNRPSAPTWADLSTTDVAAAKTFYGGLFGWQGADVPMKEAGGYGMFLLGDRYVGGYGPCMAPGQPVAWLAYFQVESADATAAAVTGNGGSIVAGPRDVFESGRLAVFADPEGAVFGVWQPKQHQGFGVVARPDSMCWFELMVRDSDRAKTFYRTVFGWVADSEPYGGSEYTEWQLEGESFSGMMRMNEDFPPEVPPHWMVYVQVEDCDAAAAKAKELDGSVHVPPTTIPPGRFALLSDPQGGLFSVIALSGPSPSGL
ncbi:VOC family protein [Streptomyces sp. NPDC056682]|uniref:VOC family protein n=1 Tax=Streptomyces sp. NPDC056682 TaxID=3345909 RepID=UPI003686F3A2